jgi:hypothetical protein
VTGPLDIDGIERTAVRAAIWQLARRSPTLYLWLVILAGCVLAIWGR